MVVNKQITIRGFTSADFDAVRNLLEKANLVVADLTPGSTQMMEHCFMVAQHEESQTVVAAAGMDVVTQSTGLLRSVVIHEDYQRQGLGRAMVEKTLLRFPEVQEVFLLTTKASEFFERLGFTYFERSKVPDCIRRTGEFSGLCPCSATVMHRRVA